MNLGLESWLQVWPAKRMFGNERIFLCCKRMLNEIHTFADIALHTFESGEFKHAVAT